MFSTPKITFSLTWVLPLALLFSCIGSPEWQPVAEESKQDLGKDLTQDTIKHDDARVRPDLPCGGSCKENQVCDPQLGCVACMQDSDCSGDFCLDGACVDCKANEDCKDKSAAQCLDNACVSCTSNAHCRRFTDATVCEARTCVECISNDDCADGICDQRPVNKNNCVDGPQDKGPCEICTSDSDCEVGFLCATHLGAKFCFKRGVTRLDCNPPYSISGELTSANGVVGSLCMPPSNPADIACATLLANVKPIACDSDTQCPGSEGICRNTICSYRCEKNNGGDANCLNGCAQAGYCL